MQYNEKKINQLMSRLIFGALLAAVIFVSVSVFDVLQKKKEVGNEVEKLNNEKMTMEEERDELHSASDYFNDQSFIEKEARRKLNMQKIGEKAIIVIDNSGNAGLPANISISSQDSITGIDKNQEKESESNQKKWFNYIFK